MLPDTDQINQGLSHVDRSMVGGLLQLGALLALPFAFRMIASTAGVLMNWRKQVIFYRKVERTEKFVLALLCIWCAWNCIAFVRPACSYFYITKTNVNAPSYLIRNRLRDFFAQRIENDTEFAEMYHARAEKLKEYNNNPEYENQIFTRFEKLEQEFLDFENLSHSLRRNHIRDAFLLFGPESLNCKSCSTDPIYSSMHMAPNSAMWYVIAFAVVGMVTELTKKYNRRNTPSVILLLTMAFEAYTIAFSQSIAYEPFDFVYRGSAVAFMTRPEKMAWFRALVSLICTIWLFVFDSEYKESATTISLKNSLQQMESGIARLQTARLARLSIMRNDALRRFCWDHYKRAEHERLHLFNDPEYKKLQAELAVKYKQHEMEAAANRNVDAIFSTIFDESPAKDSNSGSG